MAATGNPFYVEPPNIFGALLSGVQGYDSAKKAADTATLKNAYAQVGQQIATNGGVDQASLGQIIGLGPSGAPLLTAIGALQKNGQTDLLKNLAAENASRQAQGQAPLSPLQYATAVAGAGKNTTLINMPPQEKAYDTAMGKELADYNIGIIKSAGAARSKISNLDQLQNLLSDPNVYQGAGGEKVLQAKKIAKSIGIDVGDLSGGEAATAISNQLALEARNPAGGAGMPGALSDSDRNFLKNMQAGLSNTPQGNQAIIGIQRKLAQRTLDVEQRRQDYIRRKGRLDEGFFRDLSEWSADNPLFPTTSITGASPAMNRTSNGVQWSVQ
jgi:hypothetical protein